MEQTEYHAQPLAAEHDIALEDAHSHAHGEPESDFDDREYIATPIVWTAFLVGSAALVLAGIIGGMMALWFYNYTTGGFS